MSDLSIRHSGGTIPLDELQAKKVETVEAPPPEAVVDKPDDTPVQDKVKVARNLSDLPVASPSETKAFLTTHATTVPTAIQLVGSDVAITIGSETIRTSAQALGGHLAAAGVAETSALGRSVKVFAACLNANLPPTAQKAILKGFAEAVETGGDSQKAMQNAFAQVAMASLVESYINNKDGLATDMRRVGSFADDAFNAEEAGGSLKAYTNRTVRHDAILAQQARLDDALHAFSDICCSARMDGDYSAAFDALQTFFTVSAGITDTNHWRLRAADPSTACPPLPPQPGNKVGAQLLDAAMERPPSAPALKGVQVADRGTGRRFVDSLKAIGTAISNFFTRSSAPKTAIVGTKGVDAAKDLLKDTAVVAVHGGLVDGSAPTGKTDAEATLHAAFGDKGRALLKQAAQLGYGAELIALAATARTVAGLTPEALTGLVGETPTPDTLQRLNGVLKTVAGTAAGYDQEAARYVKRVLAKPDLADQVTAFGAMHQLMGTAYTLKDIDTHVTKAMERGLRDKQTTPQATINRVFDQLGLALAPKDYSYTAIVRAKIKTLDELNGVLKTLQAMPQPIDFSSAVAIATLPPDQQGPAMLKAERIIAVTGKPAPMEAADFEALFSQPIAPAVMDRFVELAPKFQQLGGKPVPVATLLDLAQKLNDAGVPPISRGQLTTAVRLKLALREIPPEALVTMLDSRATTPTIPHGTYAPVTQATVAMPPTTGDLSAMAPTGDNGGPSISVTAWWKNAGTGERIMAKVPPPNESFVPAHERLVSVLGNQLGLPVNLVQIVPVGDVTAKMPQVTPSAAVKYASLHIPVGPAPKGLHEVWTQMGLDPNDTDFRWPKGDKNCQSGQGVSSWMQSDKANFAGLKAGLTMVTLDDGSRIKAGAPIPEGRTEVSRHTYKVANPEVLDQMVAFDLLIGNSDRHPGNVLMVPEEKDGVTTYTVKLIDHGRAFFADADDPDQTASRLEQLTAYLRSLQLTGNEEHRDNVLPVLTSFANLSEDQLTRDPYAGIPDDAFAPGAKDSQIALLKAQQQLVRDFLADIAPKTT